MRLRSDPTIWQALYGLYVALFRAKQSCPEEFHLRRLTTIHTAVMGLENAGWRVVGITREALELLATVDFHKHKLPRRLCRGHIVDRAQTTRELFEREVPLPLAEYFEVFLQNDCTVIMLTEQNGPKMPFPTYVPIENPDAELFPNGSLMAWKHRKREREFLRELHKQVDGQRADA